MSPLRTTSAAVLAAAVSIGLAQPGSAQTPKQDGTAVHSDAATRRDFTRLSVAGSKAFDDVGLARIAIFDGKPAKAQTLIAAAQTAIDQAAADRTSFDKAEDRLNPPSALRPTAPASDASTPTTWIPVGESFVLDETITPTRDATKAVEKANASLRANDRQGAAATLKVANVKAIDTVALLPLHAGMTGIHRAAELMSSGDYYGASQSLRSLEDAVRYDTVVTNAGAGARASD